MKAKPAIAVILAFGVAVLGYAYVHGSAPFPSQFALTCETAIKQRLTVPSTYQRIDLDGSRRILTYDEFFTDPMRAVPESTQKAMIKVARAPPVQYIALIDYQAQDTIGAIIRERATCTFNSLQGDDAPTRAGWVNIDGERNIAWAARQPQLDPVRRRRVLQDE